MLESIENLTTLENIKKYYGGTRCINTRMLAENVGKHSEPLKPVKLQRHTMYKQGLLIRGGGWKCWKALTTDDTVENKKEYYGKARFINAGMLAEMVESIGHLLKPLKIQRNTLEIQRVLMRG